MRDLLRSEFPGDDGTASAAVTEALAEYAADPSAYHRVLSVVADARLLVPVVAVLGEVEYDDQGLAHDKSSDMATVLMQGRDGRMALLAFTSTEALARWNADGRPVPATARRAAQSAVQEKADALLVDVAGPVPFVVAGQDLVGVAEGWQLVRVPTEEGERVAWARPRDQSRDRSAQQPGAEAPEGSPADSPGRE